MNNVYQVIVRAKNMPELREKLRIAFEELVPQDGAFPINIRKNQLTDPENMTPVYPDDGVPVKAAQKKVDAERPKKRRGRPKKKKEEVTESANKEITDEFDANLIAEEAKVSPEEDIDVINIDNLLEGEDDAQEENVISAKNPTQEDVKAAATELFHLKKSQGKDGVQVIKDVLAAFKVKKVDDIPKEHYSHFIQKCRSLM